MSLRLFPVYPLEPMFWHHWSYYCFMEAYSYGSFLY